MSSGKTGRHFFFMKYTILVLFSFFLFAYSCQEQTDIDRNNSVQKLVKLNTEQLISLLNNLDSTCQNKSPDIKQLREIFLQARNQYKLIEAPIEYYFQGHSKRINGPALPDIKTDDNQVFPPHGFQVIEQHLWGTNIVSDTVRRFIQNEVHVLIADIRFIQINVKEQTILARHLQEMVQHEIIRIATGGITGLDAPLSFASLSEAIHALEGTRNLLRTFISGNQNNLLADSTEKFFDNTITYLKTNTDFDSFDRLTFIREYLMPLSQKTDHLPTIPIEEQINLKKPFNGTLADLMQGKGFNPDFYSPYSITESTKDKIELGKKLFYDTRLSSNNQISCGTCHMPNLYFTDGKKIASNFVHGGKLQRNTPGLYYSSLQAAQFYDMRTSNLEEQINDVINNEDEFNLSKEQVSRKINRDGDYKILNKKIFDKDSLGSFEIRNAIASYIRSLNPFNCDVDRYMRGDNSAMLPEAKNGFNLFMGKAKCGTCHFAPVFNGTVPPWFAKAESEVIGVPATILWQNATIDPDQGRYVLNQLEPLRYAFKTPSIRNIEKTAPYMHNGVYTRLEDVVEFYHKGGGVGIGIDLPYQSLPFDSLNLSTSDKKALVSFMKSLTDRL